MKLTKTLLESWSVKGYNQNLRGVVDIFDRIYSSYKFKHSSMRGWKSVFYYILEICLSNIYIIYYQAKINKDKNNINDRL